MDRRTHWNRSWKQKIRNGIPGEKTTGCDEEIVVEEVIEREREGEMERGREEEDKRRPGIRRRARAPAPTHTEITAGQRRDGSSP